MDENKCDSFDAIVKQMHYGAMQGKDAAFLEVFASPFNCVGPSLTKVGTSLPALREALLKQYHCHYRYFSFFDREDQVFGSSGDFWWQCRGKAGPETLPFLLGRLELPHVKDIGLECNPPFDVSVMDRFVSTLNDGLMSNKSYNVSALVVMPEWQKSAFRGASPVTTLLESEYLISSILRRPADHRYLRGRTWEWSKLNESKLPRAPGASKSRAFFVGNYKCSKEDNAEGHQDQEVISQLCLRELSFLWKKKTDD